jgi:hypothetical protein
MVVAVDVCPIYREAPDRSLGSEGFGIRSILTNAAAPPGRLDEARAALLRAFAESRQGLSFAVFQKALSLLECLPREFPLPDISIDSESSVELDWDEGAQRVVAVTVDEQPRIGFASLVNGDSQYGRFVFAEGTRDIPDTLRAVLSRAYPRPARRTARA